MTARTQLALLTLGTGIVACLEPVSRSHIDANVPDATNFDRFLQRDVDAWFSAKFAPAPPLKCRTELLRRGPTQTGISFPKYYAWVRCRRDSSDVTEGAIRLAAINREGFEVTNFVSRAEAASSPASVRALFPAALVDDIVARAK
jgi:hypothetical protein